MKLGYFKKKELRECEMDAKPVNNSKKAIIYTAAITFAIATGGAILGAIFGKKKA